MYIDIECPVCHRSIIQEVPDIAVKSGMYEDNCVVECPYPNCKAPIDIDLEVRVDIASR